MVQTIVVTGAFGALGASVVRTLRAKGCSVVAIDLAETGDVPAEVLAIGGVDLADGEAATKAFERVAGERGALDGLVNVAGGFAWETVGDGSTDTWDRMYRVNLRTAVNACRAALPLLGRGGAIVNVGALGSLAPGTGMGAYAAAKSGVARLTESLGDELRGRGIRVNAVLPSIIDTPANRRAMPEADPDKWVAPGALAEIIAFLLSDTAAPVTGALLPVAGL